MVKMLMERQAELGVDLDDLKCVSVAALCHDLGHGPFSHLFDGSFLPAYHPQWKHEQGSIMMFDHLIEQNELCHLFTHLDILFIRELIHPPSSQFKGRGPEKMFLYEIVSNRDTGIDVDKWDYFSRDCLYLGLKSSFDSQRLMRFVRVMMVGGVRQICYRDKVSESIAEMFNDRKRLFRTAYFHKTTLIIDYMVSQVFHKANDHLLIKGENGKSYKISDCIDDMDAYNKLTDDLLTRIYHSEDPSLGEARALVDCIFKRVLPKFVGKFDSALIDQDEKGIKDLMVDEGSFESDDVIVLKTTLDLGMNNTNPLQNCHFYTKNPQDPVFKVKTDQTQPIKKTHYLVYCWSSDQHKNTDQNKNIDQHKNTDQHKNIDQHKNTDHYRRACQAYKRLCAKYNLPVSKGIEKGGIELTPNKEFPENSHFEDDLQVKRVKHSLW